MWLYIITIVIVVFLVLLFAIYNSFVRSINRVKEAFSTMDVYLKKRWDLIPNMVEIVKGYAEHEKETLEDVVKFRNDNYDDMSTDKKIESNQAISNDVKKIMALIESYPELKANENFMNLSNQLTKIEDEIVNSRKYYNGTVREYNNKVQMFPSNIFAMIFGYKTKKMFETSEEERQNVKVSI